MQTHLEEHLQTTITDRVFDEAHPARNCGRCGNVFRAPLTRTEYLDLCFQCVKRWKTFCEVCPPLYRDTDPGRLPCAAETLAAVLGWEYGYRGLLLHGATGRGKTRAIWLLLRRLLDEGREIATFDCVSFSHEITCRFSAGGNGPAWARKLARVSVLFFDDMGKMRLTERGEAELFGLVEVRTANRLPLIVTCNHVGDTLAASLQPDTGGPLVRRLREFCECVAF